jgi:hypothetical protein
MRRRGGPRPFPLENVRRLVYITLIIGPFCLGCPSGQAVVDAGVAVDSGVPVVDAGAPVPPAELPPAELGVDLEVWFPDGGIATFKPGAQQTIEQAQKLSLLLPWLTDYRVRAFDGADKVLPSDDEANATDAGIAYVIKLAEPLKRGREYRVVVDAQTGPGVVDDTGRRYLDSEWSFKIEGPAEPEPAQKPGKKSGSKTGKRR